MISPVNSTASRQRQLAYILALTLLFYCLDYFFRISQSIVVPQLMAQYHIDALGIGAFASAFYLGYAFLQIPTGWLLDRYPFRYLLSLFITICVIAYIGFLFADRFWLGYCLRWLVGATSALSFISVLYIARAYFPKRYFSLLAGLAISLGTLAAAGVQAAGAWALHYVNWQVLLSSVALIGIGLAFLLLVKKIPSLDNTPTRYAWRDGMALLRNPILLRNAFIGSLFYLPTTIFASLWGVPFLQHTYQQSKVHATLAIFALFFGWAIGSPVMGILAQWMKHYYRLITGFALFGVIISCLLIYHHPFSYPITWLLLLAFGLVSSAQAIIWKVFDDHCPAHINGLGIAWTNTIVTLTSSGFHLLVGVLLSSGWLAASGGGINYRLGLSIIPCAFFLVACLAISLKATPKKSVPVLNRSLIY